MRIRFAFQGGYGGLFAARPLVYQVDTDDLPAPVRDRLIEAVRDSAILEGPKAGMAAPAAASRARDVFNYELEIADQGGAQAFRFDDANAPGTVRPLLQLLRKLALERKADR